MYLSRVNVDRQRTRNPYHLHQSLWKLFPGIPDAERPFLFRIESTRPRETVSILMQSDIEPVQDSEQSVKLIASKPFMPVFSNGQLLQFALCANPIKRLKEERCRVPLIHEDEQTAWLERKLEGAAKLIECDIIGGQPLYFRKSSEVPAGKIVTVTFFGHLEVIEPAGLLALMKSGIGPAKSFGCGMLTLARA